jgi:hypothetical protein
VILLICLSCMCFGATLGYISILVLKRLSKPVIQDIKILINFLLGGLLFKLFDRNEYCIWFYLIGIFVGLVLYELKEYTMYKKSGGSGGPVSFIGRR